MNCTTELARTKSNERWNNGLFRKEKDDNYSTAKYDFKNKTGMKKKPEKLLVFFFRSKCGKLVEFVFLLFNVLRSRVLLY